MTDFVQAGLGNALVALVLAVVALIVGLACRRPAVAHALWLLVLIKLVTPPLLSVSLPWPEERAQAHEEPLLAVTVEEVPFEDAEEAFVEAPADFVPTEAIAPMEDIPTPEIPYSAPSWQSVFGLVWLAGSLLWFAIATRRLWRFARLLRHARPASAALTERVAALSRTLGLRMPPHILLVQGHLSPMVWALGRVTLLVPAKLVTKMSATALDTLLAHELAHIRRRDHWVRWLELVGLGLYWWNPVVWLARRELRQAEELCCDAWVVRCLPDARRVYATALVDALDFLSRPDEPVPALGCGLGRVDDLKWRLTMILRGQTSPRLGLMTALGVFGLAVLLLPLVPGFGRAQPPPKPDAPAIRELDPESRDKLKAEIDALIEKRVAEAQAKKAQAQLGYFKRADELKITRAQASQSQEYQALKAEIAAKTAALKQLEAKLIEAKVRSVSPADPSAPDSSRSFTIRIEVHGLKDPADLKSLTEKLQKAVEGNAKLMSMQVTRPGVNDALRGSKAAPTMVPPSPATSGSARGFYGDRSRVEGTIRLVPDAGSGNKVTTPTPDRRIDALEKKLDAVLKELEALRKSNVPPSKNVKPGNRPGALAPPPMNDPRAGPAAPAAAGTDFRRTSGAPLPPDVSPPKIAKPTAPGRATAPEATPAAPSERTPLPAPTAPIDPTPPANGNKP
jgi:beta-lactamase regulating signal transducer with metallopeptidase domain